MNAAHIIKVCAIACALGFGVAVQAADEAPHSMTGCLQKGSAEGTYRLTDLGLANGPTSVEITESSVDLAAHVGHKVEVTGVTTTGSDPAGHAMKISAMKHLAATCP